MRPSTPLESAALNLGDKILDLTEPELEDLQESLRIIAEEIEIRLEESELVLKELQKEGVGEEIQSIIMNEYEDEQKNLKSIRELLSEVEDKLSAEPAYQLNNIRMVGKSPAKKSITGEEDADDNRGEDELMELVSLLKKADSLISNLSPEAQVRLKELMSEDNKPKDDGQPAIKKEAVKNSQRLLQNAKVNAKLIITPQSLDEGSLYDGKKRLKNFGSRMET